MNVRNGRIKIILWYKLFIVGDNSRDAGDTLTVNRWHHCQPWWGQGNCSVLLSKSKLHLLNYTSHDITQHHYPKTNIGPVGGNCLPFLCRFFWCQIAEMNFRLYITYTFTEYRIIDRNSGMALPEHFQYLHLTLFGLLLTMLKPQGIPTGMRAWRLELSWLEFPLILRHQVKFQNYSFHIPNLVTICVLRKELADVVPANQSCSEALSQFSLWFPQFWLVYWLQTQAGVKVTEPGVCLCSFFPPFLHTFDWSMPLKWHWGDKASSW